MKSAFSLIAIFLILTLCNSSCKKDKDKDTNKTVAQRIQGVWHLDKAIYNDHIDNVDYRDSTIGTASDVIDFRTDGKVYTYVQGEYDTSSYTIPSDKQITIDIQTFEIRALTDNSLTLYAKETDGQDYYEETDSFKR